MANTYYDSRTHEVVSVDGARVAAELTDSVECLVDIFHISSIRDAQRAQKEPESNG